MIRRFPLTEATARSLGGLDAGRPVAEARAAATVMCLREGDAGLEVFMIHRVATMAFAASMHVFPGGGVDDRDAGPDLPWAGPPPSWWAERLDTDEASARRFVAAAVREVFEETGVLLAGEAGGEGALADVSGPTWLEARDDLVARRASLAEVLARAGLALRSDLLSYRAHWTTPEFEPRRYDTRFFAALLPAGQAADDLTSEAQSASWVRPADLLAAGEEGRAVLLPPTVVCLEQLAAATSAAAFLAETPAVHEVMPVVVSTGEGTALEMDLP